MPAAYAHYKFGNDVLERLNNTVSEPIRKHMDLYLIGLHGPDILFYFKPYKKNAVSELGHETHRRPGFSFFQHAAEAVAAHEKQGGYLAYAYGVICHFALDVTCHGYIDEMIQKTGIGHIELESEFDRALMVSDGFEPLTHCVTGHLKPTDANAQVIHAFYESISAEDIRKAIQSMIFYLNFLTTDSRMKRGLIRTFFKLSGHNRELRGLLISRKKNPACEECTLHLAQLYDQALPLAARLIQEFAPAVWDGQPFDDRYQLNFNGV